MSTLPQSGINLIRTFEGHLPFIYDSRDGGDDTILKSREQRNIVEYRKIYPTQLQYDMPDNMEYLHEDPTADLEVLTKTSFSRYHFKHWEQHGQVFTSGAAITRPASV